MSKNKSNNSGNNTNSNSNNNSGNKKYATSPYKGNNSNKYEKYENSNDEESYEENDEEDEEEDEEEEDEEEKNEESINVENEEQNKKEKNDIDSNIHNNNNEIKNKEILNKKNIINNINKSRFDFCKKNEEGNDYIDFPKHILNLINKKINLYNLTKYMQPKTIDKIFLKDSINNDDTKENDDWTKFINDNIDTNNYNNSNNEEIINGINDINKFILNTVPSQVCKEKK